MALVRVAVTSLLVARDWLPVEPHVEQKVCGLTGWLNVMIAVSPAPSLPAGPGAVQQ